MIYTIIMCRDMWYEGQDEYAELDKYGNEYQVMYTSNGRSYSRKFPDMNQALGCFKRMVSIFAAGVGDTKYRVEQLNNYYYERNHTNNLD